jgi:hypothetical protein
MTAFEEIRDQIMSIPDPREQKIKFAKKVDRWVNGEADFSDKSDWPIIRNIIKEWRDKLQFHNDTFKLPLDESIKRRSIE